MNWPINPECRVTDCECPNPECDYTFCGTHGEEWPCEAQRAYLDSDQGQVEVLTSRVNELHNSLAKAVSAAQRHTDETARLTRIVEQILMPFMRDALAARGGEAALTVGTNIGDHPSLLGLDPADNEEGFTFNRDSGLRHIAYRGLTGTWCDGTKVSKPRKPGGGWSGS